MKTTNKYIEHWDDERSIDNGIVITLKPGYSFEHCEHQGVRGFDTLSEANRVKRGMNVFICGCPECQGLK